MQRFAGGTLIAGTLLFVIGGMMPVLVMYSERAMHC